MVKQLPNLLTGLRLALALGVFVALATAAQAVPGLVATPGQQVMLEVAAFAAFVVAAITDFFDGWLARRLDAVSLWGKILDPIADKVLMTTAFLVLSFSGALPWWLTIMVVARDAGILLTAAAISLVAGYRPFPPSMLGKTSTVAQVGTVLAALAARVAPSAMPHILVHGLIDLTAFLAVASGLHYLYLARDRFGLPESGSSVT